jgi:hypothetical protein
MALTLYGGLGTVHRTAEDARTGRNPMTQAEIDAAYEANDRDPETIAIRQRAGLRMARRRQEFERAAC